MDSLLNLKTLQSFIMTNMEIWSLTMTLENCKPSPRKPFLPHLHWAFTSQGSLMVGAKVEALGQEKRERL